MLLTGAAGYIGARLSAAAESAGWRVLRCGRRRADPGPSLHHYDCDDPSSVDLLPLDCDAVVHLAGLAHRYPPHEPTEEQFHRTNAEGARLLAIAARGRARRFVLISSIAALGQAPGGLLRVNGEPRPTNAYGRSKLRAEQAVAQALTDSGTALSILRLPAVYGPGAPGAVRHLANWVRSGRPLPSHCRKVRRSVIGISNVLDAILCATKHAGTETVLAMPSDPETPTVFELAQRMGKIVGRTAWTLPAPEWLLFAGAAVARRSGFAAGSASKVMRLLENAVIADRSMVDSLNWKAPLTLEQGLREMLAYEGTRQGSPRGPE